MRPVRVDKHKQTGGPRSPATMATAMMTLIPTQRGKIVLPSNGYPVVCSLPKPDHPGHLFAHRPTGGRTTGTDVRTNPRTHPRRREPVAASMRTAAGGHLRTRALPTTSPADLAPANPVRESLTGRRSGGSRGVSMSATVPPKPRFAGTPPSWTSSFSSRSPERPPLVAHRRAQRCWPKARASTEGNIRDWKVTSTISYFFPGGTGGPPGRGLVPQVPKVCLV